MDISINILDEILPDPLTVVQQPDIFRVGFTTTNDPFRLYGIHKIAQLVAKVLLTTKGSDTYAISIGTGIRSLIGRLVSVSNLSEIKRDIAMWVSDAERQLREVQNREPYPLDERVSQLILRSASFSFTRLAWIIEIDVITEAGESATIDITPQLSGESVEVESLQVRNVLSVDTGPLP